MLLEAHEPPQVGLDALGRPGEQLGQALHVHLRGGAERGEPRLVAPVDEDVEAAREHGERHRLDLAAARAGLPRRGQLEGQLRERRHVRVAPLLELRVGETELAEMRGRLPAQRTQPGGLVRARGLEALEEREVVVTGLLERAHPAVAPSAGPCSSQL